MSKRSSKKMSTDVMATADTIVNELPKPVIEELQKPMKSSLTKKKSTLNRLTDMIAKSPILEPLRSNKVS